jgi:hypothetical protein
MIENYFKLSMLSEKVKTANKIKSKARLDCTFYSNLEEKNYEGLTNFVNNKGQLFFYRTPCRDFINTHSKRIADWSLTGGGLNFSSIYIDDLDYPEIGYGYPNANRLLSNGKTNPLFEFRNDGYLFLINKDYSIIELFVIPGGRNLINSYNQKMIDGGFDDEVLRLRQNAKRFYPYDDHLL